MPVSSRSRCAWVPLPEPGAPSSTSLMILSSSNGREFRHPTEKTRHREIGVYEADAPKSKRRRSRTLKDATAAMRYARRLRLGVSPDNTALFPGARMKHKPAPRNAFYAQSGGVTAVINASACGVIETGRKHKGRIGKVYAGRHGILGALTEDLIDTSHESAADIRALRHTPVGRVRLGALQAEEVRGQPRPVRAPDRGLQGARHRLLLLQRRRRLGRHLPQGLAARREARLSAHRHPRAEDRRQRPADHRLLPGLRLGRQVRRGLDPRGGLRRGLDGAHLAPRCSCWK